MESSRSRRKVRSPRMKASHIQYAPEGRKGNVYIDEDGRKVYRTSGKSGLSRRYVVMDDGELKRGERVEKSDYVYQKEETEYETVSEADSDYLVPVRPKGESKPTRRIHEGHPRVLTKRMIAEDERHVLRTIDGNSTRESYALRSRPQSENYVIRDNTGSVRTREGYRVRSARAASDIVVPSRERVVSRRVVDDSYPRGSYMVRSRPSSEKRVVNDKEVVYVSRRPRSEEQEVRYVTRPRSEERELRYVTGPRSESQEVRYVTRQMPRERQPIGYVNKQISDDRTLQRQEYIDMPSEYIIPRPAVRDVGCQMTTNYVVQQPPKQKKILRNVQTQTLKKQKQRKIKTATRYYQTETVEVVQDPPTPREPTPPRRSPSPPPLPPPRIPTPEPPREPKPKKKKKKSKERDLQIVLKEPNYPEPVYDRVEDLEVVPGSSKIYYEAPQKEPSFKNFEIDPERYAYREPSEYSSSKKIVRKEKAEPEEYPLVKKPKGKAHMVRVGGGWMKVEHHRNHHTPLKIYEIPRDANDDKFLYIKSRFSTNKKEVPIAYKKYREEIIRG